MKTLILVRHAKSSWSNPTLRDRERPLNGRGKQDAKKIGEILIKHGLAPEMIMASPAVRAIKTARKLARSLGYSKDDLTICEGIYSEETSALQSVVAQCPPNLTCVCVVGHNPALTEFANRLCDLPVDNIPTAGVVAIRFASDNWTTAVNERGRRLLFERPPRKTADD